MARYRRYRRTIVRAPRKRWASNYIDFQAGLYQTTTAPSSATTTVLVTNSTQNSSPTPVVVKTGNFRLEGDITLSESTAAVKAMAYIIFVPQGTDPSSFETAQGIVRNHPEWILASKLIDTPEGRDDVSSTSKFTMSSRLKRNLNSGDQIMLIFLMTTVTDPGSQITVPVPQWRAAGYVRFWTCAN